VEWLRPKASKAQYPEQWDIDKTPTGQEEQALFSRPELLTSVKDTRDFLETADYRGDIVGKSRFQAFALRIGKWWALMLIAVIFLQGVNVLTLEPEEFIAVVTTTTASIFGIVYVVGRYLFGSKAYESKTKSVDSVAPKE